MTGEITHHLAATGRMADVNCFPQVEMVGDGLQIVGIVVEVMAVGYLRRTAVASSVMGDDAIAVSEEEQHLRVPVIGRQRPAVTEDDGLSFAPILIIDVDVSSAFFSNSDVWHCNSSFVLGAYSCRPRFISDRHQVLRSVASIQTSIRLAF